MLQLRPNCEYCDTDLPPSSTEARICTYAYTFCADCVVTHLHNVCPNCGGGFEKRPIRPSMARRAGMGLPHQAASEKRVDLKHEKDGVAAFVAEVKGIPPEDR